MFNRNLKWRASGTVLTVGLLVGTFHLATDSREIASNDCQPPCANAQQHAEEVSWSSWLTGRSTSYRLHYLDLLELLSRQKGTDSE